MKRTEFYLLDAKDDERAYIELSGEPNGLNTRVNIIVDKKSLTSEDRELVFVTYCSSLQEAIIRFKGIDLSTNTKLKKCDFDNISKFLIDSETPISIGSDGQIGIFDKKFNTWVWASKNLTNYFDYLNSLSRYNHKL